VAESPCAAPTTAAASSRSSAPACPDCRGIWLDRGELDKILVKERQLAGGSDEDFFSEVEGRRAPERDDRYEEQPRKKRRRGLLEDLLDFD
jgi:Zn-finger nucleic acid-binding protein